MTRFTIGLLLGLLLGIGGATAFLITAGGSDYFVSASPRIQELEGSLRTSDKDREWLRKRLNEANEAMERLESRFVALSTRFESLVELAGGAERARREAGTASGGSPGTNVAPTPSGTAHDAAAAGPPTGSSRAAARATPTPEPAATPAN